MVSTKLIYGVIATILLGGLILNAGSAFLQWRETSNWRPLLDSTLGIVLNSDNAAYQYEQELLHPSTTTYTDEYVKSLRFLILRNLGIMVLVVAGLYSLIMYMQGQQEMMPTMQTKLLMLGVALMLYVIMGTVYGAIVFMTDPSSPDFLTKEGMWHLVPLKGTIGFITNFGGIINAHGTTGITPIASPLLNSSSANSTGAA